MISEFNSQEKLILALDQMNESEMLVLLEKLPNLVWVKVGLELFTLLGPEVILQLRQLGKKVFLDLKFHDIPSTMGRACYRAAKTGAELITVHACAGRKALEEANQSAIAGATEVGLPPPSLLAVTVLTSWDAQNFADELGIHESLRDRVMRLVDLAYSVGLGGCVCSPLEVEELRRSFKEPFQLITPGIRSSSVGLDDQIRVMTPMEAIKAGSTKLVVGREITLSNNPQDVFKKICCELMEN